MTCRFFGTGAFPWPLEFLKDAERVNHRKAGRFHANCHDWHGLCGTGFRRLLCGFRPPGHLRGQGRKQDRSASPRRDSDLRAGAGCAGGRQREGKAPRLHHRPQGAGRRGRCRVHRGRHAVAPRRRPCRSELRLRRGARDRGSAARFHRRRHQVDRAGRHRRRGRAAHPRGQSEGRCRRRLQSGIPARGRGDPRLQISGSHRGRHVR